MSESIFVVSSSNPRIQAGTGRYTLVGRAEPTKLYSTQHDLVYHVVEALFITYTS